MLNLVLKFHKDAILKVLCLQERLSVNWAIEKSRETEIPHEIFHILLREEILVEIVSEIIKSGLKFI